MVVIALPVASHVHLGPFSEPYEVDVNLTFEGLPSSEATVS
jgi:hypothetical protein